MSHKAIACRNLVRRSSTCINKGGLFVAQMRHLVSLCPRDVLRHELRIVLIYDILVALCAGRAVPVFSGWSIYTFCSLHLCQASEQEQCFYIPHTAGSSGRSQAVPPGKHHGKHRSRTSTLHVVPTHQHLHTAHTSTPGHTHAATSIPHASPPTLSPLPTLTRPACTPTRPPTLDLAMPPLPPLLRPLRHTSLPRRRPLLLRRRDTRHHFRPPRTQTQQQALRQSLRQRVRLRGLEDLWVVATTCRHSSQSESTSGLNTTQTCA